MFTALMAEIQASTMRLAGKLGNLILISIAAMRAVGAIGPAYSFKVSAGFILVVKDGVCKVCHGLVLLLGMLGVTI